jgi:hypothetical protein
MTTNALIADRLDLLAECTAIDHELVRIEMQFGTHYLIDDARLRQQRVLRTVLLQLWAYSTTETTH